MSVRELVFSYKTTGASEAVRKDRQVRQSVRKTGKQANKQAGSVRRWAERNRKSVRMMATAMLGFAAGIASASPTLRANLSGVRAAVSLVADQIVRDLLPSGNSLAGLAIDLARWFTNLDETVRKWLSRFAAVATLFSIVALAAGPIATVFGAIASVASTLAGALGVVYSVASTVVWILGVILGVSSTVAAGILVLAAAAVAVAAALIFNIGGARDKVLAFLTSLWTGARKRFLTLLSHARAILAQVRDAIVQRITAAKDRVLELLRIGREMAARGREWIAGLARGVRDRASDLVSSFRDMASQAAQAFKDKFNELIPSRISIPSVTISIPSILGGGSRRVGGGSLRLPQLDTGGRIASDGLAMLHAGERIMPAAQVRERGPQPTGDSGTTIEEVTIVVQPMGDDPSGTGRSIAREFERELSDRGA